MSTSADIFINGLLNQIVTIRVGIFIFWAPDNENIHLDYSSVIISLPFSCPDETTVML